MGDTVLLFFERSLLDGQLLRTYIFKCAVVAAVASQFGLIQMDGHARHGIQKFTVVTDDQ